MFESDNDPMNSTANPQSPVDLSLRGETNFILMFLDQGSEMNLFMIVQEHDYNLSRNVLRLESQELWRDLED